MKNIAKNGTSKPLQTRVFTVNQL